MAERPPGLPVDVDRLGDTSEIATRELRGVLSVVVRALGVAMAGYHILQLGGFFGVVTDPQKLYAVHLTFVLVLAFLVIPGRRGAVRPSIVDWVLIAFSLIVVWYLFATFKDLTGRAGVFPTREDVIVGTMLVIVTVEAVRRSTGLVLPIVCGIFVLYVFAGPYLPGLLAHKGFSYDSLVSFLFSDNGIYGVPLGVSARYVYLFILFGAFIEASGIGKFIVNLGLGLAGGTRGGPAKVSIITSALFGTASGSSVANVMVDGVINIPLMKATGFTPTVAGGVEAMNSTGGQIVPPVMGAAAFLMADIIGVPYSTVAIGAVGPALLYYVAAYWMIDLYAAQARLFGLPRAQLPRLGDILRRHGYLLTPIVLLLYLVMGQAASPFRAALYALAATLVLSWLRTDTRLTLPKIVGAMQDGATRTIEIGATCAAAGIIVGVLSLTGLGGKFSELLINISGNNLLLALGATMIVAIVLGMGMPTTAAYAIGASVLAPALIRLGVTPLGAHMFLFYFAVISAVTPPVALAAFAAASIAKAPMWATGIQATRLSIAGFIVPYMFVYGPQILLGQTPWTESALALLTGSIGVLCLAAAVIGYLLRPATWPERALLLGAALALIKPGLVTDVVGLGLLAAAVVAQRLRPRTTPAAAPAGAGGTP
ncbi:MAG: TRAP transporter fused permease subunit [Armatimonadota bacterium]|nr:TRAP transporter fused permease subunit [Armatimonadota bacterium]MDR7496911.1 TRAP transporter fused permease subunit [Armatimonadota bacterium]